jgi:hypothetical protein
VAANLRIIYDNATARGTLSASTTAGSLAASNLLTDIKSEVWRSTATTATLTLTWTNSEFVSCVALPFCNLSSAATLRVRGYTNVADATPAIDTGAQYACPATFGQVNWGQQFLGANSYAYGGGTYGVIWFASTSVKKLVIDIADTTNVQGYIEASKLITGTYWTPTNNVEYGAELTVADTSTHERSDAGDLRTDRGTLHKVLSLDLTMLTSVDRNGLWNIMRGNGMSRPVFLSMTPLSDDPTEEQIYQVYGKLSKQGSVRYQFINQFTTSLEIEEV